VEPDERKINVSLLHVSVDAARDQSTSWDCCTCYERIVPRKLVLDDPFRYELWYLNPPTAKMVMISNDTFREDDFETLDLFRCVLRFCGSVPMVFIFWSLQSSTNVDTESRQRYWREFQDALFAEADDEDFPQEMVFVNVEEIAASDLGILAGTKTPCDSAAEANQAKFIGRLDDHFSPHHGHTDSCCENIVKARNTKFNFVTMLDYLKNWDWKGEISDEVAKAWLDPEVLEVRETE
jgi:hypothetical protein